MWCVCVCVTVFVCVTEDCLRRQKENKGTKLPYFLSSGPFSSDEMKQWFDAGYFTMELMVCRRCDSIMLPLGTLNFVYCTNSIAIL